MPFKRLLSILVLVASAPFALPAVSLAQPALQQAAEAILSFSVTPVEQLRPGEVLVFRVEGLPEARVSVQLNGASATVQLTEVSPGRYGGKYTIHLRDKLTASSAVTAKLEKNGQTATATLSQPLQAGSGAAAQPS